VLQRLSNMHKSGLMAGLCVETVVGCRSERPGLSTHIPSVHALSIWCEPDERGAIPGMCTSLPLCPGQFLDHPVLLPRENQ